MPKEIQKEVNKLLSLCQAIDNHDIEITLTDLKKVIEDIATSIFNKGKNNK